MKKNIENGNIASRQVMKAGLFIFLNTITCFIFFSLLPIQVNAKVYSIQNKQLNVSFNDTSNKLVVVDKRNNKRWEQFAFNNEFNLLKVQQLSNSLEFYFTGKTSFKATFLLNNAELEITITANDSMPLKDLAFPGAFKSPNNHFLVLTDGEGLLLPVNDSTYPLGSGITYYCGGGLSMSWMGITDAQLKSGYMAILETPYDASIRTKGIGGNITFEPVWLASKNLFSYTRKIRYIFFDSGGYVAQCKRYRDYIWKKNNVQTLKEQAKKIPAIDKMVGGVHIYVWDDARNANCSADLKKSGIDKAMFLWNPNHLPYPSANYNDSLKKMGYAVGSYELFTDAHPRDTNFYDLSKSSVFLKLNAFPGLFNSIVARKKDGSTYSNQFGHYTNPKAIFPEVQKRTKLEMSIWPHETYFVDVCQANGLYECYSKENPLTRQQWAEATKKTLQYIIDEHKVFLGAEWGADFAAAQSVYAHGMMTIQRTWFNTEIVNKETIYYYGDWKNGQRPSIMLGSRTAPPGYLKYSINESLRVPLYELVYHDAVVTSWRWEDANHHAPEIWWKKDLFNILYGSAPLWTLDVNRWQSYKKTFIASYKNVAPWLQQIGYDEMVNHKFISADRKIQESVFSSGKRVIVNFSDEPYLFNNKTIAPKSYITL
jgi:Glycosyl hydrolases related to GH101 family, GH129